MVCIMFNQITCILLQKSFDTAKLYKTKGLTRTSLTLLTFKTLLRISVTEYQEQKQTSLWN